MGSYRFKWPHAADEVIVTGTFDNWAHEIKLDKKEQGSRSWHEKVVELGDTSDKILYKFVVNGQWRTDPSHAVEKDHEGNENNVLDPEDIMPSTTAEAAGAAGAGVVGASAIGAAAISSVGPGATTTGLAGAQPVEDRQAPPGAFPEEPAGAPATLQDKQVGIDPIPATSGIGNPVSLQPGEKVPDPSTLTGNTVGSTVTTDKDSYERGAGGAAYSPADKADDSSALYGRPASSTNIIPESGLPMGDSTDITKNDPTQPSISSVGPGATTAALAGQQPIEPRGTPEVVSKSEEQSGSGGISGAVIGTVAGVGAGAAGAAVVANEYIKDKTGTDPKAALPNSAQAAINDKAAESSIPQQAGVAERETASNVPDEVVSSQKEADAAPEATGNEEAVKEKSEAENELLSKVPEQNQQGEPAPTASAATATTAPVASSGAEAAGATVPTTTSSTGAPQLGDPTGGGLAPINMDDQPAAASKDGLNASAEDSAKPVTQSAAAKHRDVSPMTPAPKDQDDPMVTTGVAGSSAPQTSGPQKRHSIVEKLKQYGKDDSSPSKSTTSSSAAGETPKKEKRRSFFSKLKEKLKSSSNKKTTDARADGPNPRGNDNSLHPAFYVSDSPTRIASTRNTPFHTPPQTPPRSPATTTSVSVSSKNASPSRGRPRYPKYIPPFRTFSPLSTHDEWFLPTPSPAENEDDPSSPIRSALGGDYSLRDARVDRRLHAAQEALKALDLQTEKEDEEG